MNEKIRLIGGFPHTSRFALGNLSQTLCVMWFAIAN